MLTTITSCTVFTGNFLETGSLQKRTVLLLMSGVTRWLSTIWLRCKIRRFKPSCFYGQVVCSLSVSFPLSLICFGIPPTFVTVHVTWWGAGVMGQWWGDVDMGGGQCRVSKPFLLWAGPPCLPSLSVGELKWTPWEGTALRCGRLLAQPHPKAEEGRQPSAPFV